MKAGLIIALFVAAGAMAQTPETERILKTRCVGCHGPAQQMSGLRLDAREPALAGGYSGPLIVPGNSADSKLIKRVTGAPGMLAMPPSGPRLKPEEIAVLKSWIDDGAKWAGSSMPAAVQSARKSSHWAFQPVSSPVPPPVK